MSEPADRRWMLRALELAERGWGQVSPNPLVGAVVVQEEEVVVGEGWHAQFGGPHAEVGALRAAGERARGATLYVSLEPCAHHGKTPPCTEAVLAAGVTRVVVAAPDPNPRARGGAEWLRAHGVNVITGVEAERARDQNAAFFHRFTRSERPWIALKLALSLDAALADSHGCSRWITGEPARSETHRLRAGFDAVAVGSGTALADDPLLTVRGPVRPRIAPVRVVFDRRLRLSPSSAMASSTGDAPLWVLAGPTPDPARRHELEACGAEVIPTSNLADALRQLWQRGIGSLFCEGGGALAGALLAAAAVDRMFLFYAPVVLGAGAHGAFHHAPAVPLTQVHRWRHLGAQQLGADTLLTLAA